MAAETQVTAHVVVPDATRADTDSLTALERMTLQMTATLHLEDVLATITHGLVEEFHAAFGRPGLLGAGDLCTVCPQDADCATRVRCFHLQASAGLYTNLRGDYRRVPLGIAKIGRIAVGWGPTYTHDTLADDRLPNKPWLRDHGRVLGAVDHLAVRCRMWRSAVTRAAQTGLRPLPRQAAAVTSPTSA
jgi:hypothetical protein